MVKRSKGTMSGRTRKLRGKSRVSVAAKVRTFKIGSKVVIAPKTDPSGQPHLRYRDKHGTVVKKQGKSYLVEVDDYKKKKKILVGPVHLELTS